MQVCAAQGDVVFDENTVYVDGGGTAAVIGGTYRKRDAPVDSSSNPLCVASTVSTTPAPAVMPRHVIVRGRNISRMRLRLVTPSTGQLLYVYDTGSDEWCVSFSFVFVRRM